jgi:hypothetical protein
MASVYRVEIVATTSVTLVKAAPLALQIVANVEGVVLMSVRSVTTKLNAAAMIARGIVIAMIRILMKPALQQWHFRLRMAVRVAQLLDMPQLQTIVIRMFAQMDR